MEKLSGTMRVKDYSKMDDVQMTELLEEVSGKEFVIEGLWKEITGKSWMFTDHNPACMKYAFRTGFMGKLIPTDDDVYYGKIGAFGHLIHISELEPISED